MRPIGCPETSVTNYQTTLRNVIEKQRSRFTFSAQKFLSLWLAAHGQKLSVEPSVGEQSSIRSRNYKAFMLIRKVLSASASSCPHLQGFIHIRKFLSASARFYPHPRTELY
jgi:hypothetical protein